MGFQLGPRGQTRQASGVPWHWILITGVVVGGAFVGWLSATGLLGGGRRVSAAELEIDPRPVIVSLQHLGELHTVKLTMKEVLRETSEKDAEGWMRGVPGGDSLTHWATHNQVLVVAEGTVEAGIDLSRISAGDVATTRQKDGTACLRVRLPRPIVYPPNIILRVENVQGGLLWRDDNLVPKAQAEASSRFKDAAEKDHIIEKAQESAVQKLQQMEQALGRKNVEFFF